MKTRLQKSIEYIKGYCDKHDSCDFCRLQEKDTKMCMFKDLIPAEWEYKADRSKNDNT